MSAVGNIGQFIIDNQYSIEVLILVLLAVIVVLWLVNRLVTKKKHQSELETITAKLDELEAKIGGGEVTREIESADEVEAEVAAEVAESADEVEAEVKATAGDAEVDADTAEAEIEEVADEMETTTGEVVVAEIITENKPKKFATRDWNEDRYGNIYTEEVLRERIG